MKHFIDITDHSTEWLHHVLTVSQELRTPREAGKPVSILTGQSLAMIFEKPSLRTRVSFEQAMNELGGHAIVLQDAEVGLGRRESVADVTRVLNGMVHGIMARVFEHEKLVEMTQHATVPIINALSDASHPCQSLADALTMQDEFGQDLAGRKLTFIGDGNNVALSLARLCAKLDMRFAIATPPDFALEPGSIREITDLCPNAQIDISNDPAAAVADTDAIYADTFVSMGQEDGKAERIKAFEGFQIDDALLNAAPDHAIVLHCLPAYRGIEIAESVIEGPRSRVFPQAHNRLHAQKGLLAVLMGGM